MPMPSVVVPPSPALARICGCHRFFTSVIATNPRAGPPHQRRAIEPECTTHAARYAGDRNHLTLVCAVYPKPTIERLVHDGDAGVHHFGSTTVWRCPVTEA
ncbi:hypothetical protein SGLAM104S_07100 [Streptomyces glaucescens]